MSKKDEYKDGDATVTNQAPLQEKDEGADLTKAEQKMVKEWAKGLGEEKSQLDSKLTKLVYFLDSPGYHELDRAEQERLTIQRGIMESYSNILGQRLDAVGG